MADVKAAIRRVFFARPDCLHGPVPIRHLSSRRESMEAQVVTLVGRGRCAELRAIDESRLLKLYEPRFSRERVEHFAATTRRVIDAGVPTPGVYSVETHEDRHGIVMDRIDGSNLWEAVRESPAEATTFGRRFGQLHLDIHQYSLNGLAAKLDEVDDRVRRRTTQTPQQVERALVVIERGRTAPPVLVHGDLHPANVMADRAGALTSIDWDGAMVGPAAFDVARAYLLTAFWALPPGTAPVAEAVRRTLADAYLDSYLAAGTVTRPEIAEWLVVCSLARYGENIPEEIPLLDAQVRSAVL